MKKSSKGANRAIQLLDEIGFEEITDIPIEMIVSGLGATFIEEPMNNSDGKIIRGIKKTIIKVNSDIPYESKKRFTIAHEIGHLLMHDKLDVHHEDSRTTNWFKSTENQAKKGKQEWEANDFASELLMPSGLFLEAIKRKGFNHNLIKSISDKFKTSLTSTVYRFAKLDAYPILVVYIHDGIVHNWSKSDSLWGRVKEVNKLPPPEDSVALEYIESGYEYIYEGNEKSQTISKSTWFELRDNEDDRDFFEYCIPTKAYKTIISVIWED